jgi:acetyl-CoA/propionyl-CoA carboxylase biotin carboxyl carrier protein
MRFTYRLALTNHTVDLERASSGWRATVDGLAFRLEVLDDQPGQLSLLFEGRPLRLFWAKAAAGLWVSLDGCTYWLEKPGSSTHHLPAFAGENTLRAPMPAQVRSVEVALGQRVQAGQTLLLLEAMKMEIRIVAPRPGQVLFLAARPGQAVEKDQLLVEIGDDPCLENITRT